jgi:hypothetical protein
MSLNPYAYRAKLPRELPILLPGRQHTGRYFRPNSLCVFGLVLLVTLACATTVPALELPIIDGDPCAPVGRWVKVADLDQPGFDWICTCRHKTVDGVEGNFWDCQ